jgi:Cdc6-like AAA superfamily ATPase
MSTPNFDLVVKLSAAFSPSAPIDHQALFAGRIGQFTDVLNAINQKGQHVVLFGERGVGKTSLARVLSAASSQSLLVASVNCDPTMDFSQLWHRLLREITLTNQKQAVGFTGVPSTTHSPLNEQLPAEVTPDDVRRVLRQLGRTLFVIDELDRLCDPNVTTLLADTIKGLSDHAVNTTILLVGVADSVDALIAEHQSVERALVQVRMPRMSPPELEEIINKGLGSVGMSIEDGARRRIVQLSQGLPHYTHLLAQNAGQRAAQTGRTKIEATDVRTAIDNALSKAQQTIISAHHQATLSPRENMYAQVLLACALAEVDSLGYFSAVDVRHQLAEIMGKRYEIPAFSQHLNAFCESKRGPVLQRVGTTRRYRFRFVNPLMQPFVIMDGLKKGLIKDAQF